MVAVASSALFDLSVPHEVFRTSGTEAYREFQRVNENVTLPRGVAFPFIQRLLSMNAGTTDHPVEVILVSRNDPDTGARVFRSIEAFGLPISRAAFLSGGSSYPYIKAFGACLFLSADESNVREAIMHDCPAGRVLASSYTDDPDDRELRIAFDFDGVIIDDEAERVYMTEGLERFHATEVARALEAHSPGPLKGMLEEIGKLQRREIARAELRQMTVAELCAGCQPLRAFREHLERVYACPYHVDLPGLQVHDVDLDRGVMETTRVRPSTMAKS